MIQDPELERRIADVLAKLATLSEVPAASIGHSSPSSDRDQQIPAGVYEGRSSENRPPSQDRSLFDYWSFMFARAENDSLRWFYVYRAEADYSQAVHRIPESRATAVALGEDRNKMMVELYEGWPANQAAVAESLRAGYCSEKNMEKVRRDDRRDPKTGRKLAGFAGWSDEERTKAVMNLKRQGLGKTKIARELGVSEGSVQRYLGGYKRRVA